jgi:hypothetical protein
MAKIYAYAVSLIILVTLTGCGPAPIKMKVPGYSIGPVSSEDFPDLVQSAIPPNKGEARIFGKANWLGFVESPGYLHAVTPYFSGVVALTDTDIFLLLYNDDEQRYEILTQVPYTGISFDPKHGSSAGGPLCLYIEEPEFSFGEKRYTPYERTYLEFTRPTGIRSDPEKNKLAHLLFEEKVARHIAEQPPITSFDDQY